MKMPSEPAEEETTRQPAHPDVLMDLDLDLDGSWPLDQIFAAAAAASNPASPFLLSNSEQPCSPLWAFSDDNNSGSFAAGAGFRLADSSRILSYAGNPDTATEGAFGNDDRKKLPSPFMGLMPIDNPDGSCIIKERMTQALRYFKDLTEQHVLAQRNFSLPVFEPSGQSCVGVLELIMTSQKINYAPEVDKVCKALEAVNLKSSEILDHQSTQICNEGRQNALAEILEIITVVCETHTLPLAQTWVPCRHGSVLANGGGFKKTCSSFDGSCMGQVCMSTTDVAFYVVDARIWGFREACAEHHLQKGQGVAGRAFASHNICFCQDITEFCKTEYHWYIMHGCLD
ncbi:UNVERIFIED_CONTAM: protein NLP7 [Sesamum angustifolium]|uniref:Protein NLP7 n=1 Tax=Sesamum angustifolium TaxID=2727405 RepID=A0AAW2M685_9LAMI